MHSISHSAPKIKLQTEPPWLTTAKRRATEYAALRRAGLSADAASDAVDGELVRAHPRRHGVNPLTQGALALMTEA